MSIETKFLQQLDPDVDYSFFNGTPAALLAEIEAAALEWLKARTEATGN